MAVILLAVVGSINQSNAITMMSLLWWGALTNQNHAGPVEVYHGSLPQEVTAGVYCGRSLQEFTTGGYHGSLMWEFTAGAYHGTLIVLDLQSFLHCLSLVTFGCP